MTSPEPRHPEYEYLQDPAIQAHLAAQDDVPDGFVKLSDGRLVPLGGHADNGEDDD